MRVYAFGDLHGRLDLAQRLRSAIVADADNSATENVVVGLGDMIDRGPDAKGVIDLLLSGFEGCEVVCLRGNHEQMMLDFLEDPARNGPVWFRNGADTTLASYGVSGFARVNASAAEYQSVRDSLARSLPPSHTVFLQGLRLSYEVGDYFFVHAGARPGIPLNQQVAKDLLWIRHGFADTDPTFEKVVVHGHTPVEQPYFGAFRINLDTGAYSTNALTCAVFEEASVRILEL